MAGLVEGCYTFTDAMTSGSLTPDDIVALNRRGQFAGFKQPLELRRRWGVVLEADPHEKQRQRLVDAAGQRWKVVIGGKDGFNLTASYMKGKGRTTDLAAHAAEQAGLAGYVLVDVPDWPLVRVIVWGMATLTGETHVRRAAFHLKFNAQPLPLG